MVLLESKTAWDDIFPPRAPTRTTHFHHMRHAQGRVWPTRHFLLLPRGRVLLLILNCSLPSLSFCCLSHFCVHHDPSFHLQQLQQQIRSQAVERSIPRLAAPCACVTSSCSSSSARARSVHRPPHPQAAEPRTPILAPPTGHPSRFVTPHTHLATFPTSPTPRRGLPGAPRRGPEDVRHQEGTSIRVDSRL